MKDINRLRKYPEYRHAVLDSIPEVEKASSQMPEVADQELVSLIFAPDPRTGLPRSDLSVIMSKDSAPEVAQYIRDNLMQVRSEGVSAGDDADLALASIKSREESIIAYAERLRELTRHEK